MYCDHGPGAVLTGDLPILRLLHVPTDCGLLTFGFIRDGKTFPLEQFSERHTEFRAGKTSWTLSHEALPGVRIVMEALTLATGSGQEQWKAGVVVRFLCENQLEGDELTWSWHAPNLEPDENLLWAWDPNEHPDSDKFLSALAFPNPAEINSNGLRMVANDATGRTTHARSNQFLQSKFQDLGAQRRSFFDFAAGLVELIVWSSDDSSPVLDFETHASSRASDLRASQLQSLVKTSTPDIFLDSMVPFSGAAMEGQFYPPLHLHGAMSWNKPYLGWRGRYAPTVVGLGKRVVDEALQILKTQKTSSDVGEGFKGDSFSLQSLASINSRFYGKGHIPVYSEFYNMQEVYFDQLIHAWEWSGSPELEEALIGSLDAHLNWMRECFDPLDTGLFESYLNVWASDSIWYAGSATVQSTAYAYRSTLALAKILKRRGQLDVSAELARRAEEIRLAVIREMWLEDRGHLAESRDRNSGVTHNDPSLYSIFLPIDAGLLSPLQAAQNLYFSKWGLERQAVLGGELCWTSNWVPYEWSVRELDFADSLHLALAYFQAGNAAEGHKLFFGCVREASYNSMTPGAMVIAPSNPDRQLPVWRRGRATDFADTVGVFLRTLVEGLFGMRRNGAEGVVELHPNFPASWDHAELETLDARVSFEKSDTKIEISLHILDRPLEMRIRIPLHGRVAERATLNGQDVALSISPGLQGSQLLVRVPMLSFARLEVFLAPESSEPGNLEIVLNGENTELIPGATLVSVQDPRHVVTSWSASKLELRQETYPCLVRLELNQAGSLQLLDFEVPATKNLALALKPIQPRSVTWRKLEFSEVMNCDLSTIFLENYKRPDRSAISAQLGSDGYSPWTYSFWGLQPPQLQINKKQVTSQGTDFNLSAGLQNTAMASCYDRWPNTIRIEDVAAAAGEEVAILLVSTVNHMTTGLPNARLSMHSSDGNVLEHTLGHPTELLHLAAEYDYEIDSFALKGSAEKVGLGKNCTGTIFRVVAPDSGIAVIELSAMASEIMVGILAISIATPQAESA